MLFTDLVGSTDLMSRLGEAAFDELRRAHFAALRQAIDWAGGEEIKNTGDGVMATFGSVVDAIHCAAAMQQGTDRHARTAGVALAVRVGLSLGEVTFEGEDVFGTAVVEAARLVGVARAGQILCSALVRTLAQSRAAVRFVDVGSMALKGLVEPVAVCEVAWEPLPPLTSVPMPPLLIRTGRIFVGRDGPLHRCLELWKEAVSGERRVALLAGEAGIGKTRLAVEVAGTVMDEGAMALAGRCDEDLGVPYQPFVEALRHYAGHVVAPRLGRHGGELVRLVPEVADGVVGLAEPLRSDPETERYRLFDAVAMWLSDVSVETPVLLVLDDLHWAAKPTLLLLRHVLRSPAPMRLLVVATYRDTDIERDHPLAELLADLRKDDGVERLSLVGLDRAAVGAYIEAAAGHPMPDDAFAQAVWEETEGHPFFMSELLRHLSESGAIEQRDGRWAATMRVEDLGIPEGVREVVGRRLARLSPGANRVLGVGAVAGLEFEPGVVRAALPTSSSDDELFTALEEAMAARLLVEVPGPPPRYRFVHALVRATLYDELSAARRVALHGQVAEAIEAVHGSRLDDHFPALAHHFARAGDRRKAVDYNARAGDRALTQLAHDEAVAYYHQALDLLGASDSDEARQTELLIALGEAQRRAGDPAHRETLLNAARLAEERSDADALARAALANQRGMFSRLGGIDSDRVASLEAALCGVSPQAIGLRARLFACLSTELHFSGDTRPLEFGREALRLARQLDDPGTLAEVLPAVWLAIWGSAPAAERSGIAAQLAELLPRLPDPILQFQAAMVGYVDAWEHGDVERANVAQGAFTRVAEELGQPALRWRANWLGGVAAIATGRFDEAERIALETLRLGEVTGQTDTLGPHLGPLGVLRLHQGRPQEAVEIFTRAMDRFPDLLLFRVLLARACAEADRRDQAGALLDEIRAGSFGRLPRNYLWLLSLHELAKATASLEDAEQAEELYVLLLPHQALMALAMSFWAGPVAHVLGLLATTLGEHDQADVHFASAAEVQARIGGRAMSIHTDLAWARMLLARRRPGDAERARDLLAQTLATARELGLGNLERRAVALLQ